MLQAFQAFVITSREGIEAFLIVAISLAYLRKVGRAELTRAVHWGIGTAVALSAGGGYILYHAANQEMLDGPLAILAAVVRYGRKLLATLRASQEQVGALLPRAAEAVDSGAAAAVLDKWVATSQSLRATSP